MPFMLLFISFFSFALNVSAIAYKATNLRASSLQIQRALSELPPQDVLNLQVMLGKKLIFSRAYKRNIKLGFALLEQAADKNHMGALNALGVIYMKGLRGAKEITKNIKKSQGYFLRASSHKSATAFFYLAEIENKGLMGGEPDLKKAISYYVKAAQLRHRKAKKVLKKLAGQGNADAQKAWVHLSKASPSRPLRKKG